MYSILSFFIKKFKYKKVKTEDPEKKYEITYVIPKKKEYDNLFTYL